MSGWRKKKLFSFLFFSFFFSSCFSSFHSGKEKKRKGRQTISGPKKPISWSESAMGGGGGANKISGKKKKKICEPGAQLLGFQISWSFLPPQPFTLVFSFLRERGRERFPQPTHWDERGKGEKKRGCWADRRAYVGKSCWWLWSPIGASSRVWAAFRSIFLIFFLNKLSKKI